MSIYNLLMNIKLLCSKAQLPLRAVSNFNKKRGRFLRRKLCAFEAPCLNLPYTNLRGKFVEGKKALILGRLWAKQLSSGQEQPFILPLVRQNTFRVATCLKKQKHKFSSILRKLFDFLTSGNVKIQSGKLQLLLQVLLALLRSQTSCKLRHL